MLGNFSISGKIIAITGGASGIGLSLSKLALASKANVIIADLKLSNGSEKLVAENRSRARFLPCDVSKWKDMEGLVSFSEKHFGDVPDVYVANAGISDTSFWTDKDIDRYGILDINLGHPMKLTRIAIRSLQSKNKKGVVAITASIAGLHGHYSTPLYVASKHGTIGFIKSMAQAERELSVKVVGVCPGPVETPLMKGILDKLHDTTDKPPFLAPMEIAERIKDLIEQERYPGGTALGVYQHGDATVVADGENSHLEDLLPSDLEYVRGLAKA